MSKHLCDRSLKAKFEGHVVGDQGEIALMTTLTLKVKILHNFFMQNLCWSDS